MNENFVSTENNESSDVCDKVKMALYFGESLDDDMQKHLEECEDCRTFLEQSRILDKRLADIGNGVFSRNGVSIADAVMNEIGKQSVFTGGAPLKKNGFFRHGGLIAACLIVMVMALPVLNGMFSQKNESADFVSEYRLEIAKDDKMETESLVDAETEMIVDLTSGGTASENGIAKNKKAVNYSVQDDSGEHASSGAGAMLFAAAPASAEEEESYEYYDADVMNDVCEILDVESIAIQKADVILGEDKGGLVSSEIIYPDENHAVITLEFENKVMFIAYCEFADGEWIFKDSKTEYKN